MLMWKCPTLKNKFTARFKMLPHIFVLIDMLLFKLSGLDVEILN